MKYKLAIKGGKPILKKPLPNVYNIGDKEIKAVNNLLKRGPLSDFVGAKGDYFLGGKNVKRLESLFCKKFKIKHAVSFNSATTALHGAIVALGIGPGDEVIVTPYSMSASATCVLMNGAIPVFADINDKNFCLDPKSIKEKITSRTKAIMVVNLFGCPADFDEILKIAKENNLKIIEDNAQAPGAKYKGRYTGTIGDIGIFSFNVHKVIQSGEGGVLITNNKNYAFRAQLCRNHGEVYSGQEVDYSAGSIIGSNYRMTEIEAVIAYEQLLKLDFLNKKRLELVKYLTDKLKNINGLELPFVTKNSKHVFYVYPIKINEKKLGISRDLLVKAMEAEGFPMSLGYTEPLYMLKVFQDKKISVDYSKGICPVCERMYEKEFTFTTVCQYSRTKKDIDLFVKALRKVLDNKLEIL
ncbi:DegT/DnrJ/EryC1/StrS family aminotransferase [Patescibacteria group bacterium]|nr:DegT/DnrJ/EryC1/StrS family aminotransferase [Patescibacteria group bacterium]